MAKAESWIALIRAIGGATHAKMSMADLREAAHAAGLGQPRTVLATGNLIFESALPKDRLAATLDRIIAGFGLNNRVFLRRPSDLRAILALNPLPDTAEARPNHLLVLFLDRAPTPAEIAALTAHGGAEPMQVHGSEVFIDYRDGVGTSKLNPARLERLLGQPGTGRNWNTLRKLVAASG